MTKPTMPSQYPDTTAPAVLGEGSATPELLAALVAGGIPFDRSDSDRRDAGRDWWPLSIGWVAEGRPAALPGVVVRPQSDEQVQQVMAIAHEFAVPVTAQGGRSGVVGGAVPMPGGIALDLTGLAGIRSLDTTSLTVTVGAGTFGPDLEAALAPHGVTVGHFPQSFDLATVGGWVACRGAGQLSNRYGKIEDIVRGLRVILAGGALVELGGRGPRSAVGPDLLQLFIGSEGTLGVIVEVTLAVHPVAPTRATAAYSFATFAEGNDACRRILQRDAHPAVLRLYDESESKRNFDGERCVLIVLDEGDPGLVAATMAVVAEECASAQVEDARLVDRWLHHRNDVSALAPLWERGIVVDTIEIAGPWSTLDLIHRDVVAAIRNVPGTVSATVHQSHAYLDGACLYFTFAGRPEGDRTAFYRAVWDVASRCVLEQGGALSHHHGVGRNRARFMPEALGTGFAVLEQLKATLDPKNICNPGVLGLGGASW
jgi:alkyldihydroxyacetonephosphate synthase